MPLPIRSDSQFIDLTKRFQVYKTVDASPALAAETVIATLTLSGFADTSVVSGIQVEGWAAYTVGTSGTAVTFRIRQTGVAGTIVASTGALSKTAASLYADVVSGFDAGAGIGVYALTMQVTSGGAASTVSALLLKATIVQARLAVWADDLCDRNSPQSANPGVLASSYATSGYLRVYGWTVYNSKTSAQYLLVFDRSSLPADTAVPLFAIPLAASSQQSFYYGPMGRIFQRGLVLCNSSTDTTKTIGAEDCFFDVQFDNLPTTQAARVPIVTPGGGKGIASTSGTNLAVDNFGDFIVTGEGGNSGQVEAATSASAASSTLDSNSGLHVNSDGGQIVLNSLNAAVTRFSVAFSSELIVLAPLLPTADPHVVGQLWNSAGTMMVSAG